MLQSAYAKMQGKERKGQFQDNSSNSQEGAIYKKKGGGGEEHSFPFANSVKIE